MAQQELSLTLKSGEPWKPPTEPINTEWKPPTEPVDVAQSEPEESTASRVWNTANRPLVNFTPELQKAMASFQQNNPIIGGIGNLAAGSLASMTSPLSLGLMATGGAGTAAEKLGMPMIAKALEIPGRVAAGGMVGHGLYNMGSSDTTAGKIGGGAEAILGALGLRGSIGGKVEPAVKPPVNPAVAEAIVKPAEQVVRQPIALLPEKATTQPPRFISGEQGIADATVPNKIDLGPNPENLSGTVLPQEFGSTHEVPPEIAAKYTGEGKPTTQIPVDPSRLLTGETVETEQATQPRYNLGEGTARPGEPQLPSATPRASFSVRLGQELDKNPAFATGDIPKPPIEIVQDKIPSTPNETVVPGPGRATPSKDVNRIRAEGGSVNQTLASRPETKPIADIIVKAQDDKMQWIASTERQLASITKGLRKADRVTLGRLIDGQEVADALPELRTKAQQVRMIMDNIYESLPEGSRWNRSDVNYIQDYLTHIEKQPEDIQSAMKDIWDYHFGEKNSIRRLFKRDELGVKPGEKSAEGIIYDRSKGDPKSPFTETRTGREHQYELDVNKVFPAYVESIAKVIYDRPAVDSAKELINGLADSKIKELASWYVKNYTKYDAMPGLTEAWNSWASTVSRITSRSLLSFNPGLQTLHVARLVGNMWPELGSKYSAIGLKEVATHPVNAWFEAAKNGLLYNEVRPLEFKTPMQRFDSVANMFSIADYLDKAIGFHGYKRMFLDQGMSEEQAISKAISETKRVSLTADPARITKTFAADSPILGGAIGTLAKQYKQVPVKIIEQYATIVANIKNNPQAAARLTAGVAALLAANEVGGLHTFHLGSNVVPKDLLGAFGSAVSKVTSSLVKGDWQQAVIDTALWATPGGQSLNRQITQGQPSIFENQKQPVKLKFINP